MFDTLSPFKDNLLQGKVALVTGGGSGIGLEITRQLGLHGARVVISGRRESVLSDAVRSLSGEGIVAHSVQVRHMSDQHSNLRWRKKCATHHMF